MKRCAPWWIAGSLLLAAGASGRNQYANRDIAAIEDAGGKVEADPNGLAVTADLHQCEMINPLLASLGRCTELRVLHLSGTGVTDSGLEHLKPLARLEVLDLNGCGYLTGCGLKTLASLNELRELDLSNTSIGDDAVDHLVGLRQLQILDLRGTRISDAGLEKLKALPLLERLDLCSTAVTDSGLDKVRQLPRLRALFLGGCPGVTDAGVQQLRRAVPTLRAVRRGRC